MMLDKVRRTVVFMMLGIVSNSGNHAGNSQKDSGNHDIGDSKNDSGNHDVGDSQKDSGNHDVGDSQTDSGKHDDWGHSMTA